MRAGIDHRAPKGSADRRKRVKDYALGSCNFRHICHALYTMGHDRGGVHRNRANSHKIVLANLRFTRYNGSIPSYEVML